MGKGWSQDLFLYYISKNRAGSQWDCTFGKIGSHIQYHKELIALINIITRDILVSWYLMAKYSDGSGKSLLSLAIKVGRFKVFPNKGDRKQITVKMKYSETSLWVIVQPDCRSQS